MSLTVLSIDIGTKNLAMCLETFDKTKLNELEITPELTKRKRYTSNGEPTPVFIEFLNKFYTIGKTIWLQKADITDDDNDKFVMCGKRRMRIVETTMLLRLNNFLKSIKKDIDKADVIVIEQQLKTNPNAQYIQHHIQSVFLMWYNLDKPIISFPSKNKTQILGAPKKVEIDGKIVKRLNKGNKNSTKSWACDITNKILTLRNDENTKEFIFIKNKSKRDDLSDVIIQANTYFLMKEVLKEF
jgi:hypothetical protein